MATVAAAHENRHELEMISGLVSIILVASLVFAHSNQLLGKHRILAVIDDISHGNTNRVAY